VRESGEWLGVAARTHFHASRRNAGEPRPRARHPSSVIAVAGADDPPSRGPLQSERAAQLLDLLGLTEDELCALLAVDPLTLLSGQLDHRPELTILQDLLADAQERAGAPVLRRWIRARGSGGRPIDALTRRDFTAFEDALTELADRGFVLRGGGAGSA
jgi:hypothetical protein